MRLAPRSSAVLSCRCTGVDGPALPPRERAERLLAQEVAALLSHDNAKYPVKVRAATRHISMFALTHWRLDLV